MKRSAPLERKTRIKPVNSQRRKKRKEECFGPQAELCRTLPCCICGAEPPSDPAHVRSRGAMGKDRANVIPLCRICHQNQEATGWCTAVLVPVGSVGREVHAEMGRLFAQGVAVGLSLVAYKGVPEPR